MVACEREKKSRVRIERRVVEDVSCALESVLREKLTYLKVNTIQWMSDHAQAWDVE